MGQEVCGRRQLWCAAGWLNSKPPRPTQLAKDGKAFFNSAFHNLHHVCAMAAEFWTKGRINIGRFNGQGNEAMNKKTQV